jgi:hypothetical protein
MREPSCEIEAEAFAIAYASTATGHPSFVLPSAGFSAWRPSHLPTYTVPSGPTEGVFESPKPDRVQSS